MKYALSERKRRPNAICLWDEGLVSGCRALGMTVDAPVAVVDDGARV